jgi:hypothetical protein
MKKKLYYTFKLLMLFSAIMTHSCHGQSIAGTFTNSDVYTDLIPDSIQNASAAPHASSFYEFLIDLDLNGQPDLKISSGGGGGLGGGSVSCHIYPLGSYAQIASHYDTFQICCPSDVIVLVATQFELQDSINEGIEYHSDDASIYSYAWGAASSPWIPEWCNIGERYIGFRLCYSFDTLYGWIRINATDTNDFRIEIMDFACNQNTSAIIPIEDIQGVPLFPNPFMNELQLNISLAYPVKLTVFSFEGKLVIDKTFNSSAILNTDFLAAGMYHYQLKESGKEFIRGKLIKRE